MNKDWLDIDVLEDYLDGKLDAKGMHFVERQALDDPFVAEALEGLRQSPKRKQNISILQRQLYHRIANEPVKKKLWGITTHRLSIAATATVAFIAVSILFFMRETNHRNEMAQRKSKGVIVSLDTNTALAATPRLKDTVSKDQTAPIAAIEKAIKEAKGNQLAKNKVTGKTIEVQAIQQRALPEEIATAKISPSSPVAAEALVYSGNVTSLTNGAPIQGAVVKLAGSKSITATDAKGNFYLPADSVSKSKDIMINALGFRDLSVKGVSDPGLIKNALTGDKSIEEIAALVGSNGRKKEPVPLPKITLRAEQNLDKSLGEITKPIPVSTINYESYLERNNKLLNPSGPAQYVIIRFNVKKNGRPSNVEIIKGITKKLDAEARRLVLDGPDWVLPKNGNDLVEMSIKF